MQVFKVVWNCLVHCLTARHIFCQTLRQTPVRQWALYSPENNKLRCLTRCLKSV